MLGDAFLEIKIFVRYVSSNEVEMGSQREEKKKNLRKKGEKK